MRKGFRSVLSCLLLAGASGLQAETSREFRATHNVGIDAAFSVLSLPFPGAKGAALNINLSDQWQLGLSYMNSGFEVNFSKLKLAGFKERHAGLLLRRFFGNSFNLSGGYVYRTNEVYLDPEVYGFPLSEHGVRSEAYAHMAQLSIANHWQQGPWTLAVDWLTLVMPVSGEVTRSSAELADENQRDDVRQAENVLTWYPNMAVSTLRLGYMF